MSLPLKQMPIAVVLDTEQPNARLGAVNRVARRYGIGVGQTVVEAQASLANLAICSVAMAKNNEALARVAEVAMSFGSLVSIESESELSGRRRAPDTVWVDITGAAHLKGGELELCYTLEEQVRALGHEVRIAVACGKYSSQAFARWSHPSQKERALVVPQERTQELLAELPVLALPLSQECGAWLARLGILSIKDLNQLPRASAVSRLGPEAQQVLDLCVGKDDAPLVAYQPARLLIEKRYWDEPLSGIEPLLFALRGLTSRLSARLAGRGEAVQTVELTIQLDKSIAELEGVPSTAELRFDLASPLWKERELSKVISSRLERLELGAPSLGVCLTASNITPAIERQLDLSRVSGGVFSGVRGHEELPVLLAELNADIGKKNVGVLTLNDDHLAELKSVLVPVKLEKPLKSAKRRPVRTKPASRHKTKKVSSAQPPRKKQPELRKTHGELGSEPMPVSNQALGHTCTRLLSSPVRLTAPLKVGATVSVGSQLCSIQELSFEYRLDSVKWWKKPITRDYFKVLLKGPQGVFQALVYVERETGRRYLQAICD